MSNIEWTDETWNPVTGCTPVSPGCLNCYAAGMARRLEAMGRPEYVGLTVHRKVAPKRFPNEEVEDLVVGGRCAVGSRVVFSGKVNCLEDRLAEPLHWRKPRRVFVNSMSDLFHEAVPFEFIDRVFALMALCPQHTFQVLTKRPERMAEYLREFYREGGRLEGMMGEWEMDHDPWHGRLSVDDDLYRRLGEIDSLTNVWLGTSVEDQARADERIPHLLRIPAAVRFVSFEPLLEDPFVVACPLDHPLARRGRRSRLARRHAPAPLYVLLAPLAAFGVLGAGLGLVLGGDGPDFDINIDL